MDHAYALTDAWEEHGGFLQASEVARLLDLLDSRMTFCHYIFRFSIT
jgi:hypothetical protein